MKKKITFNGLKNLPIGRPLILQGSIRNHIFNYRVGKDIVLKELFNFLLYEKQVPFLLVPAFTFSVFKSLNYWENQESEIGYISKYVERNFNYIRTSHPMYSFYVISNDENFNSNDFSKLDNKFCFGLETCFDYMVRYGGLQVCLNLSDEKCMTFYHHAEKLVGASHRFEKEFYVNDKEKNKESLVSVYVRKPGISTNVSGIERLMWSNNVWNGLEPGTTKVSERWCDLNECVELFTSIKPKLFKDLLYDEY